MNRREACKWLLGLATGLAGIPKATAKPARASAPAVIHLGPEQPHHRATLDFPNSTLILHDGARISHCLIRCQCVWIMGKDIVFTHNVLNGGLCDTREWMWRSPLIKGVQVT